MAIFQKTAQAEEDLIDIWLYISLDNPELGQARPDIAEDFRYLPLGHYLMLYRIIPNGIELVRVIQGMRLLSAL